MGRNTLVALGLFLASPAFSQQDIDTAYILAIDVNCLQDLTNIAPESTFDLSKCVTSGAFLRAASGWGWWNQWTVSGRTLSAPSSGSGTLSLRAEGTADGLAYTTIVEGIPWSIKP